LLALKLLKPGLQDNIPVAEGLSLISYEAPVRWLERTIKDLDLRRRFNCNVVAIKRSIGDGAPREDMMGSRVITADAMAGAAEGADRATGAAIVRVPRPEDIVRKGDVLLILGRNEDLDHLTGEE
jgi:trk system potassium uptake protein TrkA